MWYFIHVYLVFVYNLFAFCSLPEVPRKGDNVKQHIVTEEMLDEVGDIWLSETDTITLLDIPTTIISEDADDAEAIK